ncbi:hypothetical protein HY792_04420 [Candidatus Desantisbacteria bacterium]|nr:hypothetical protein [Candidatus Desantisbacteria bacterium]
MRQKVGDYLLDVSKLIFAGVVLGSILGFEDVPKMVVLILGSLATLIIALVGFMLEKEG